MRSSNIIAYSLIALAITLAISTLSLDVNSVAKVVIFLLCGILCFGALTTLSFKVPNKPEKHKMPNISDQMCDIYYQTIVVSENRERALDKILQELLLWTVDPTILMTLKETKSMDSLVERVGQAHFRWTLLIRKINASGLFKYELNESAYINLFKEACGDFKDQNFLDWIIYRAKEFANTKLS